jgi:hypothetical protein
MSVYSHIIPPQTTADELRAATRPFYDGPLVTAFDLMTLTIGRHLTGWRERGARDGWGWR